MQFVFPNNAKVLSVYSFNLKREQTALWGKAQHNRTTNVATKRLPKTESVLTIMNNESDKQPAVYAFL